MGLKILLGRNDVEDAAVGFNTQAVAVWSPQRCECQALWQLP
jgi:hypothetical protein